MIFEKIFRRKWPMSKFKSGRYCLNLLLICVEEADEMVFESDRSFLRKKVAAVN